MKISVNDQELFTLNEIQFKVLGDSIGSASLEDDLKRRLQWVLMHKYEESIKRLREQWIPKFKASGVSSVPLDDEEFARMVFEHPEYKSPRG